MRNQAGPGRIPERTRFTGEVDAETFGSVDRSRRWDSNPRPPLYEGDLGPGTEGCLRALAGSKGLQFARFGLPALDIWNLRVDALMYAFCTRGCDPAGCDPPLSNTGVHPAVRATQGL
jgi:hypothetical protein